MATNSDQQSTPNNAPQATNVTLGRAQNVKAQVKGNILTIQIDLSKNFGQKEGGKTENIATVGKPSLIPGTNKYIGLTVYQYPQR